MDRLGKIEITPYTFGLCLLAAGLTLSPFLMSIAQFWLLAAWLFDGVRLKQPVRSFFVGIWNNIKTKLGLFWHNKAAVAVVSLYLLHIAGLIWTTDFDYAFKDLRVKLPLFILPIIMSSMPKISMRQTVVIMTVYVLSVFAATLVSFYKYVTSSYDDIRQISSIISHIRFSLNILLCMCILLYAMAKEHKLPIRLALAMFFAWFAVQIYIMQVLSAYVILPVLIVFAVFCSLYSSNWNKTVKWTVAGLVSLVLVASIGFMVKFCLPLFIIEKVDLASLPEKTALGNLYVHDTTNYNIEDGRYVGLYHCPIELRSEWNKRSEVKYDDTISNGMKLKCVLLRYMTSKNLTKDAAGMGMMSDEDIVNVLNGVENYKNHTYGGVRSRLSVLAYEINNYRLNGNPNGGSVAQRIEYTKASLYLISKHPIFGVGTGDIPNAYQEAYVEMNSRLDKQYRYKAHNQYLSITVGFGVLGLLLYVFSLIYPAVKLKNRCGFLYMSFLLIILLSMLPEDTIETQAGVTFFAFFNAFFLFAVPDEEKQT